MSSVFGPSVGLGHRNGSRLLEASSQESSAMFAALIYERLCFSGRLRCSSGARPMGRKQRTNKRGRQMGRPADQASSRSLLTGFSTSESQRSCDSYLFRCRGLFTGNDLRWSPRRLSGLGVVSRVVAKKAFCWLAGPEVFSKWVILGCRFTLPREP